MPEHLPNNLALVELVERWAARKRATPAGVIGNTGIVLSRIRLDAVVGGNEVTNPFVVTEVYVQQGGTWTLASLSFTRLLPLASVAVPAVVRESRELPRRVPAHERLPVAARVCERAGVFRDADVA